MAQTPSYAPCWPIAPYFLNIFTPLSHLYIADTGSSYQHFCPFVQEFAPRRPAYTERPITYNAATPEDSFTTQQTGNS
jgi:hypothetical protein